MDLQSRKIEFVQKFLTLMNEESIKRLETHLNDEVSILEFDLKKRILESEHDFENGNTISNSDLVTIYND